MSDIASQDESFSALLDDQRRHWRGGERYLVEAYLEQYPRLLSDPVALLALIRSEIDLRREIGENPQPDEYLRRFPQLDTELRKQFGVPTLSAEMPGVSTWPSTASQPVTASNQPLQANETLPSIPGYEIQQLIDSGGQGEVYKARHIGLDRIVALKLLRDDRATDPERLARFRREGKVIARLEHPQIVRVHDFGESGGRLFLSMEYLAGGTLKDRLAKSGPWEPQAAIDLLLALTDAVEHAHQKGIVHRDLKPGNVLFTPDDQPKVADFGLAKLLDDTSSVQTRTGAILGSPSYMAPEQAEGRVSLVGPATDVYALGAILYEVLTGRPPFRGESWLQTLDLVRTQPVERPSFLRPSIPQVLERVCLKCLEKEVKRRYESAASLALALQERRTILESGPTQPSTVSSRMGTESFLPDDKRDPPPPVSPGYFANHVDPFVGGYRLIKRLGAGAFGEVWLAEAPGGVPVALKKIYKQVGNDANEHELKALRHIKNLKHPYLLGTQAFGITPDRFLYIAMELAEGNLRDRLKAFPYQGRKGVPHEELLRLLTQAAQALDYVHSNGLSHRDIKPDNIFTLSGFAKVGDFGLVRNQGTLVNDSAVAGTLAYMAPECFAGSMSQFSDQYSLAISYVELRSGRRPFPMRDNMFETMMDHREGEPDLSALDPAERPVVLRALAKNPEHRFARYCQILWMPSCFRRRFVPPHQQTVPRR